MRDALDTRDYFQLTTDDLLCFQYVLDVLKALSIRQVTHFISEGAHHTTTLEALFGPHTENTLGTNQKNGTVFATPMQHATKTKQIQFVCTSFASLTLLQFTNNKSESSLKNCKLLVAYLNKQISPHTETINPRLKAKFTNFSDTEKIQRGSNANLLTLQMSIMSDSPGDNTHGLLTSMTKAGQFLSEHIHPPATLVTDDAINMIANEASNFIDNTTPAVCLSCYNRLLAALTSSIELALINHADLRPEPPAKTPEGTPNVVIVSPEDWDHILSDAIDTTGGFLTGSTLLEFIVNQLDDDTRLFIDNQDIELQKVPIDSPFSVNFGNEPTPDATYGGQILITQRIDDQDRTHMVCFVTFKCKEGTSTFPCCNTLRTDIKVATDGFGYHTTTDVYDNDQDSTHPVRTYPETLAEDAYLLQWVRASLRTKSERDQLQVYAGAARAATMTAAIAGRIADRVWPPTHNWRTSCPVGNTSFLHPKNMPIAALATCIHRKLAAILGGPKLFEISMRSTRTSKQGRRGLNSEPQPHNFSSGDINLLHFHWKRVVTTVLKDAPVSKQEELAASFEKLRLEFREEFVDILMLVISSTRKTTKWPDSSTNRNHSVCNVCSSTMPCAPVKFSDRDVLAPLGHETIKQGRTKQKKVKQPVTKTPRHNGSDTVVREGLSFISSNPRHKATECTLLVCEPCQKAIKMATRTTGLATDIGAAVSNVVTELNTKHMSSEKSKGVMWTGIFSSILPLFDKVLSPIPNLFWATGILQQYHGQLGDQLPRPLSHLSIGNLERPDVVMLQTTMTNPNQYKELVADDTATNSLSFFGDGEGIHRTDCVAPCAPDGATDENSSHCVEVALTNLFLHTRNPLDVHSCCECANLANTDAHADSDWAEPHGCPRSDDIKCSMCNRLSICPCGVVETKYNGNETSFYANEPRHACLHGLCNGNCEFCTPVARALVDTFMSRFTSTSSSDTFDRIIAFAQWIGLTPWNVDVSGQIGQIGWPVVTVSESESESESESDSDHCTTTEDESQPPAQHGHTVSGRRRETQALRASASSPPSCPPSCPICNKFHCICVFVRPIPHVGNSSESESEDTDMPHYQHTLPADESAGVVPSVGQFSTASAAAVATGTTTPPPPGTYCTLGQGGTKDMFCLDCDRPNPFCECEEVEEEESSNEVPHASSAPKQPSQGTTSDAVFLQRRHSSMELRNPHIHANGSFTLIVHAVSAVGGVPISHVLMDQFKPKSTPDGGFTRTYTTDPDQFGAKIIRVVLFARPGTFSTNCPQSEDAIASSPHLQRRPFRKFEPSNCEQGPRTHNSYGDRNAFTLKATSPGLRTPASPGSTPVVELCCTLMEQSPKLDDLTAPQAFEQGTVIVYGDKAPTAWHTSAGHTPCKLQICAALEHPLMPQDADRVPTKLDGQPTHEVLVVLPEEVTNALAVEAANAPPDPQSDSDSEFDDVDDDSESTNTRSRVENPEPQSNDGSSPAQAEYAKWTIVMAPTQCNAHLEAALRRTLRTYCKQTIPSIFSTIGYKGTDWYHVQTKIEFLLDLVITIHSAVCAETGNMHLTVHTPLMSLADIKKIWHVVYRGDNVLAANSGSGPLPLIEMCRMANDKTPVGRPKSGDRTPCQVFICPTKPNSNRGNDLQTQHWLHILAGKVRTIPDHTKTGEFWTEPNSRNLIMAQQAVQGGPTSDTCHACWWAAKPHLVGNRPWVMTCMHGHDSAKRYSYTVSQNADSTRPAKPTGVTGYANCYDSPPFTRLPDDTVRIATTEDEAFVNGPKKGLGHVLVLAPRSNESIHDDDSQKTTFFRNNTPGAAARVFTASKVLCSQPFKFEQLSDKKSATDPGNTEWERSSSALLVDGPAIRHIRSNVNAAASQHSQVPGIQWRSVRHVRLGDIGDNIANDDQNERARAHPRTPTPSSDGTIAPIASLAGTKTHDNCTSDSDPREFHHMLPAHVATRHTTSDFLSKVQSGKAINSLHRSETTGVCGHAFGKTYPDEGARSARCSCGNEIAHQAARIYLQITKEFVVQIATKRQLSIEPVWHTTTATTHPSQSSTIPHGVVRRTSSTAEPQPKKHKPHTTTSAELRPVVQIDEAIHFHSVLKPHTYTKGSEFDLYITGTASPCTASNCERCDGEKVNILILLWVGGLLTTEEFSSIHELKTANVALHASEFPFHTKTPTPKHASSFISSKDGTPIVTFNNHIGDTQWVKALCNGTACDTLSQSDWLKALIGLDNFNADRHTRKTAARIVSNDLTFNIGYCLLEAFTTDKAGLDVIRAICFDQSLIDGVAVFFPGAFSKYQNRDAQAHHDVPIIRVKERKQPPGTVGLPFPLLDMATSTNGANRRDPHGYTWDFLRTPHNCAVPSAVTAQAVESEAHQLNRHHTVYWPIGLLRWAILWASRHLANPRNPQTMMIRLIETQSFAPTHDKMTKWTNDTMVHRVRARHLLNLRDVAAQIANPGGDSTVVEESNVQIQGSPVGAAHGYGPIVNVEHVKRTNALQAKFNAPPGYHKNQHHSKFGQDGRVHPTVHGDSTNGRVFIRPNLFQTAKSFYKHGNAIQLLVGFEMALICKCIHTLESAVPGGSHTLLTVNHAAAILLQRFGVPMSATVHASVQSVGGAIYLDGKPPPPNAQQFRAASPYGREKTLRISNLYPFAVHFCAAATDPIFGQVPGGRGTTFEPNVSARTHAPHVPNTGQIVHEDGLDAEAEGWDQFLQLQAVGVSTMSQSEMEIFVLRRDRIHKDHSAHDDFWGEQVLLGWHPPLMLKRRRSDTNLDIFHCARHCNGSCAPTQPPEDLAENQKYYTQFEGVHPRLLRIARQWARTPRFIEDPKSLSSTNSTNSTNSTHRPPRNTKSLQYQAESNQNREKRHRSNPRCSLPSDSATESSCLLCHLEKRKRLHTGETSPIKPSEFQSVASPNIAAYAEVMSLLTTIAASMKLSPAKLVWIQLLMRDNSSALVHGFARCDAVRRYVTRLCIRYGVYAKLNYVSECATYAKLNYHISECATYANLNYISH